MRYNSPTSMPNFKNVPWEDTRTPNTRTGTTREMVAEVEERRDGEDAREGGMGGDGRRPTTRLLERT